MRTPTSSSVETSSPGSARSSRCSATPTSSSAARAGSSPTPWPASAAGCGSSRPPGPAPRATPDLTLCGAVVPRFGQVEQVLSDAALVIGGSGGIFAHALARLGRRVRLVAAAGADPLGDLMRQLLSAGGVDTSGLLRQAGRSS